LDRYSDFGVCAFSFGWSTGGNVLGASFTGCIALASVLHAWNTIALKSWAKERHAKENLK
jgi:hypothetical protein